MKKSKWEEFVDKHELLALAMLLGGALSIVLFGYLAFYGGLFLLFKTIFL